MLLRRDPLSRLGRLILMAALVLAWSFPPRLRFAFGQATQPSDSDAWQDPQQRRLIADQMERDFAVVEQADRQIPRDTFDPAVIVNKVGRDPGKLAAWVRDNTFFVPYRGALRGAHGVLMDRLGSNLDRALLLAELLRVAGHELRLAHTQLGDEDAKALLSKLSAIPDNPARSAAPASGEDADAELAKVAQQRQLDVNTLRSALDETSMSAAKLAEQVIQQTAELKQLISQSIGKTTDAALAQQRAADDAERLAAVKDAWWVQVKTADGWVDHDLMKPEPSPASGEAKSIAPDPTTGAFALEPADCHEVVVRVIVERCGKDGLKEQTALTHALRPYELYGLPVTLANLPMKNAQLPDVFNDPDANARIRAALLEQDEWLPALFVGKDLHAESSFNDAGELEANAVARLQSLMDGKAAGSRVGDVLRSGRIGGMGGGAAERKHEATSQVTAEWIEYDFRYAGRSESVVRRDVFDLIGPDARVRRRAAPPSSALSEADRLKRALALAGHTSILVVPCRPSGEFVEHVMLRTALSYRKTMPAVMRDGFPRDAKSATSLLSSVEPLCTPLYFLAAARHAWSRNAARIYIDRPNVFSFHQFGSIDTAGKLGVDGGFDIVSNRVNVTGADTADAFAIRMEQGILDSCIEAAFGRSDDRFDNAADVTARATAQSIPCQVIRAGDDPSLQSAKLPANALARLKGDVAAGQIVLAPQRAVNIGAGTGEVAAWWTIDPRTGTTVGMGERGWGQTASEYFLIVVMCTVEVYVIYLAYLSCRGSHGPLHGLQNAQCQACAFFSGFCTALAVYGLLALATGAGAARTFQIVAIGIGGGRGGGVIPGPSLGRPAAGVALACSLRSVTTKIFPNICKIK